MRLADAAVAIALVAPEHVARDDAPDGAFEGPALLVDDPDLCLGIAVFEQGHQFTHGHRSSPSPALKRPRVGTYNSLP